MRISSGSAYLQIELEEEQLWPDRSYSISAFRDGFSGRADKVFITADDADRFLNQLDSIRVNNSQSAELRNLSSGTSCDPFMLVIHTTDSLGHLRVSIGFCKVDHQFGGKDLRAELGFSIDREYFDSIILDFMLLFQR